ncbi:MAG: SdrD B-like domain-containing protein [Pseudomonadota bacterium]
MTIRFVQTQGFLRLGNTFNKFRTLFVFLTAFISLSHSANAQQIDWLVNIDDSVTPAPAGGILEVPINIDNNGFGPPNPAPETTLIVTVPTGLTLESITGDLDPNNCSITAPSPIAAPLSFPVAEGNEITCIVPEIASGGSADSFFGFGSDSQGTYPLTATIGDTDDNNGNNTISKNLTLTEGADMVVTAFGPMSALSGEVVDYTFTIENMGPNEVEDVTVSFPIPSGVSNVTPPAGCILNGSTYECFVAGPIAVDDTLDFTFGAQISAEGPSTLTLLASVSEGDIADPTTDNNTVTFDTTVSEGSDVGITKSILPTGVLLVGDQATFTLSTTYTGNPPSIVTVTDTIPANYTIDAVNAPAPWVCTVAGNNVACEHPGGAAQGTNISLGDIEIVTTIASAGTPTNTAEVSADGPPDPNPLNDSDTDGGPTLEDPFVDFSATKSGPDPQLTVVNEPFDFNVSTTNTGNADFVGTIELIDTLPANMEVQSIGENGWSCTPPPTVVGPATITCSITYTAANPLPADTETPIVVLTSIITSPVSLTNGLEVRAPDCVLCTGTGVIDTASFEVTAANFADSADVSLVKTAQIGTLAAGEVQTFDLEIINSGDADAVDVRVRDILRNLMNNTKGETTDGTDNGIETISYTNITETEASCSVSPSGGSAAQLACDFADNGYVLPVCTPSSGGTSGTCPIISVEIRPGGDGGTYENTASAVSFVTPDPNLSNNTDTVDYVVEPRVDITIEKSGSATELPAGQDLTYVIAAINKNNGLSTAANMTMTDVLPADLTFVSATPSVGTCTTPTPNSTTLASSNNTVACDLGNIANGAQESVTIVVRPNYEIFDGSSVTPNPFLNNASVAIDTTQIGIGDESDAHAATVTPPSLDLLVQKSDSVDPLPLGDNTVYTLTVRNLGPSAAQNVALTDTLPPSGLEFVAATPDAGGSCTSPAVGSVGGTLACDFPYLAAGEVFEVQVEMTGIAKGTADNTVTVTSTEVAQGYDTNTANNTAIESTSVRTRSDVSVDSKVATPSQVNLLEGFDYTIRVAVNVGPGLVEADEVIVADSFPANMELTGPPVLNVVAGSVSRTDCFGDVGDTSFTCFLGTFEQDLSGANPAPGFVDITIPVVVTSITSDPQTLSNTANIETESFESDGTNNDSSGDIIVNASSISGTLYRDFNEDGTQIATDIGVAGVTLTLTGTAIDGSTITETVTTDANGDYSFSFLPAGTYSVTRGAVSEDFVDDGASYRAGSTTAEPDALVIDNIAIAGDTAYPDNDFTIYPIARIGAAKQARGATAINPDGSFEQQFRIRVENFSLEALNNVTVTDVLSPEFGTYTTGTLAQGQYTLTEAPNGTCANVNTAFDGQTDASLEGTNGFTLASGAICQIDFTIQVQPTDPLPAIISGTNRYENQVSISGVGALSGQDQTTNPLLADLSDRGNNADRNDNGVGNDANEDRPTPIGPVYERSMELIKSASSPTTALGNNATLTDPGDATTPGDTITFTFEVTNTGNLNLDNLSITDDAALGTITCDETFLAPGASTSCTAANTYAVTYADIYAGGVENTAIATASSPFMADDVTDISDTGTRADGSTVANPADEETPDIDTVGADDNDTDNGNDPTPVALTAAPGIDLIKSASTNFSTPPSVGDTIDFTFTVENTGNTLLSQSAALPSDTMVYGTVAGGTAVTTAMTLSRSATSPDDNDGILEPSEVIVFEATYTLDQDAINAGGVHNTADTSGETVDAAGDPVASVSDVDDTSDNDVAGDGTDGVDADGGTDDNPTVVEIERNSSIELLKSIGAVDHTGGTYPDFVDEGDVIPYTFTVTNTGNVTLTSITITDPVLVPTAPNAVTCLAGFAATLAPTASTTCTIDPTLGYTITDTDAIAGSVENTATVTGQNPQGEDVTDVSDNTPDAAGLLSDGADVDGDTTDGNGNSTILTVARPEMTLTKSVASFDFTVVGSDTPPIPQPGDTLTYEFVLQNTGSVPLYGASITDDRLYETAPHLVVCASPIPSPLPVGASHTCLPDSNPRVITSDDIFAGGIENTATANASTEDGGANDVDDVSDTGTDPVGGTSGVGETVETADIVLRSGDDLLPDTTDTGDDHTSFVLESFPRIELVKSVSNVADTNGDGIFGGPFDVITYEFYVSNRGNVSLANVAVNDPGLAALTGPSTFTPLTAPDFDGDLAITDENVLAARATYTIQPIDIATGSITNTAVTQPALAVATDSSGQPIPNMPIIGVDTVSDNSDTGTENAIPNPDTGALPSVSNPANTDSGDPGNAGDDPTVVLLTQPAPSVVLEKAATSVADTNSSTVIGDIGDVITYTFTIRNTGNTILTNFELTDTKLDPVNPITCDGPATGLLPVTSYTCTATYAIDEADFVAAEVENTASIAADPVVDDGTGMFVRLVDNTGADLADVVDTSDTASEEAINGGSPTQISDPAGTDSDGSADGNNGDEPTILTLPTPNPAFEITKSADATFSTPPAVGDTIAYTFEIENTGNVVLDLGSPMLLDTMTYDTNGTGDPVDVPLSLSPPTHSVTDDALLQIGETITITAMFTVDQKAIDAGGVHNTASATGNPVDADGNDIDGLNPVDQTSDNDTSGEGTDGTADTNGNNPTVLPIAQTSSIELIKEVREVIDTGPNNLFGDAGDQVIFDFYIRNTGNVALAEIAVSDTGLEPSDGLNGVLGPVVYASGFDAQNRSLAVGDDLVFAASVTYTIDQLDVDNGSISNTATAASTPVETNPATGEPDPTLPLGTAGSVSDDSDTGTDPEMDFSNGDILDVADPAGTGGGDDPTVLNLPQAVVPSTGLTVAKSVTNNDTVVAIGDAVPFTIVATNENIQPAGLLDMIDILPVGLTYVPGSATIDGVATTPTVSGQRIVFEDVIVPSNGTMEFTVLARVNVNAPTGKLTNQAFMRDPATGDTITNIATATVERIPEHVFDCSDVIGKVFDDKNQNGYHDKGEPGLPGARVVTVNGVRITTDDHGRYHIPCAELPEKIGSNFILKLDERSLPSGYRLTTENPRVERLTAGKFAKLNFGASISNVIRIDLNSRAFVNGHTEPSDAFKRAIDNLLRSVEAKPSVLRLTYVFNDNAERDAARARVNAVEKYIRHEWRNIGRYKLNIERTIKRAK